MRINLATIIFFLFNFFGNGFDVLAQENYEIRRINFYGNKTLDEAFLLEKMALKECGRVRKGVFL